MYISSDGETLFGVGFGMLVIGVIALVLAHRARNSAGFFSNFEEVFNFLGGCGLVFGGILAAVAIINT